MSYSSYRTQQQMAERITVLEVTLALLIDFITAPRDTVDVSARTALLDFAQHIHDEHVH